MDYSPALETFKLGNYGIMLSKDFDLIKDDVPNTNVIHLEYRGNQNTKIVVYHNFNQIVKMTVKENLHYVSNITDLTELKKALSALCKCDGELYERETTTFNKAYYYARKKIPYEWNKLL